MAILITITLHSEDSFVATVLVVIFVAEVTFKTKILRILGISRVIISRSSLIVVAFVAASGETSAEAFEVASEETAEATNKMWGLKIMGARAPRKTSGINHI
jgi:hypothetical protein